MFSLAAFVPRSSAMMVLFVATVWCLGATAFVPSSSFIMTTRTQSLPSAASLSVTRDDLTEDVRIRFEDEEEEEEEENSRLPTDQKGPSRWEQLDPKHKERLVQEGRQRAIQNKKKRGPLMDKKRQLLKYVKEQQQKKKRAAKVHRPLSFNERTLVLSELENGQALNGTVISLTNFGAYVDVGTEVDGLLHVSQLSRTVFVENPRQLLSPGDEIDVRVKSTNAEKRKLHLTMLPPDIVERETHEQQESPNQIPLTELQTGDELWGELKRVTDFGAYVEVGVQVDGWLHFMDHPGWEGGSHPSEFMAPGDRVRVWVSDVDLQQKRIKVTANRPQHLPGPRREFSS